MIGLCGSPLASSALANDKLCVVRVFLCMYGHSSRSENYHTAKYDKTGSNENYHPRDSSSGDADAMEPAWWRPGPGANSEYTGHAMDGEIYNPPDVKIFKPFMMKTKGARQTALYDIDGPSPVDIDFKGRRKVERASWAASGKGTTTWMLSHEGPLLAQQQEGLQDSRHPEQDATAMQVKHAEQLALQHGHKGQAAKRTSLAAHVEKRHKHVNPSFEEHGKQHEHA